MRTDGEGRLVDHDRRTEYIRHNVDLVCYADNCRKRHRSHVPNVHKRLDQSDSSPRGHYSYILCEELRSTKTK